MFCKAPAAAVTEPSAETQPRSHNRLGALCCSISEPHASSALAYSAGHPAAPHLQPYLEMASTIATPPPDAAVRALLTELGLSHLMVVFAEHEVDDAAFVQLKDADLRDIKICLLYTSDAADQG